jgi:hypothetical protein
MPVAPSIVDFVTDPQLLGLSISPAQETLLRSTYGLPLTADQLEIFRKCSGRSNYPGQPFGEVTVIAGARSGKDSRIGAPIVVYEALFGGHEQHLARGERGVIPLVAQDQRATRIAFGYIRDYMIRSSLLAPLIAEVLASEIVLTNGLAISCFPCTLRSLRGWSIPAAVMDELAFYRLEGQADSDVEVQASIRRGMIAFPATRLVKISTPYMKGGVLYEDFSRGFGQDDPDLLVWQASSLVMNPSLRAARLEREQRLDPSRFAREYAGEFADDLEAFLPTSWIDQAVISGRHELPPCEGKTYVAAVDPSGGGPDAFTLAIVHHEGSTSERRILHDVMKGWTRRGSEGVDLDGIVNECVAILKRYGITTVLGDDYAGQWVKQAFQSRGIRYDSAQEKSKAYVELEPLFAQGRIDLIDHPQLARELKSLERRLRSGGRVLVDHPRGGHDDHANALALAAAKAIQGRPRLQIYPFTFTEDGTAILLNAPTGSHARPMATAEFDITYDGPKRGEITDNLSETDPLPEPCQYEGAERCEVTGNPCGIDPKPEPCRCLPCRSYRARVGLPPPLGPPCTEMTVGPPRFIRWRAI